MSKKLFFLTVLLVGVVNSVSFGYPDQNDYSIPRSLLPTLDGVISPGEWEKAEWIDMNEPLYGTWFTPDLSNCRWTALWSPENNILYVAVQATDTDHLFKDAFVIYNAHDDIEIFIDANESNTDVPALYRDTFRYAQHYFMGPDTSNSGGWVAIGGAAADHLMPAGYAVVVVGDVITYEFALTPYKDFDIANPENSTIVDLQVGELVGLDIDIGSKYDGGDGYGRISEHRDGSQWQDANTMLDLLLVNAIDTTVAHLESPWKYETEVSPQAGLSWIPGDSAVDVDVYFGDDFNAVSIAGTSDAEYIATLPAETNSIARPDFYPAGELEMGKTYYWRIDGVNDFESPYVWKGNVWHFTVDSGKAGNPSPADKAESVPWTTDGPTLSWTKGLKAATNDVYFGTSFDDVNNAGKSDSEYIGNQTDCNIARADYYPGDFAMDKTYYWRIDSINDLDDRSPWKGNVWSFTISDHLVLDDFESYTSEAELRAVWKDYYTQAAPRTYCYAYRWPGPAKGAQSMKLNCMNSFAPYYSEVRQTFTTDQDWSATCASGVKALSLLCYGKAGNVTDYLYVWLKDSAGKKAVQRLSDPDLIKTEEWTEVNFALRDFNSPEVVDLSQIRTITIGVGQDPPVKTSILEVYIDNVRLYIPRCLPEHGPAGDVTGNCLTDFRDLKIISRDWGITAWDVNVIAPVNDPCLWYKFDNDACDFSGNGYNGTVVDDFIEYDLDRNGQLQKSLLFDGHYTYVDVPLDVFTDMYDVNGQAHEITISLWHFGDLLTWDLKPVSDTHRHLFFAENPAAHPEDPNNTWEWRNLNLYFQNKNSTVHVAMGNDGSPAVDAITKLPESEDVYEDQWNHWAVTKDAVAGELKVYLNGALWNWNTSPATIPIANIGVFRIGAETGREDDPPYSLRGYLTGKIDDFRIYDYALSQGEICSLADMTIGSTYTQPMQLLLKSDANTDIYEDGTINFKDHAVLANTWLEEKIWP